MSLEAVDQALNAAEEAFIVYRRTTPEQRAQFLERIAEEILAIGDALLERAHQETGLPLDRLTGERGRTVGQLRLFAEVVREGSWLDARIDTALPDRKPVPKPDLRRMLHAARAGDRFRLQQLPAWRSPSPVGTRLPRSRRGIL